jgi:hypothetical protein
VVTSCGVTQASKQISKGALVDVPLRVYPQDTSHPGSKNDSTLKKKLDLYYVVESSVEIFPGVSL